MSYIVLDSIRNQNKDLLKEQFAEDVQMGFSAKSKFLPSKYFYDDKGSELFQQITDLKEYYITQCEFETLGQAWEEIADTFKGEPFEIIELGAGDGRKTKELLSKLKVSNDEFSYIPVDISEAAVADLVTSLQESHPEIISHGVVGEYFDSIQYIENISKARKLVMFLGSNIGNFDLLHAMKFLHTTWERLNEDDLFLVGFDLKKNIDVMLKAYNDPAGITSAFNLNVLQRINNELGGNFDLSRFSHYALYNPIQGAMESYLISLREQTVAIDEIEKNFHFDCFEAIHLEYSYKYLLEDIENMAKNTGFEIISHWHDSKSYFVDSLWRVKKSA